MLEFPVAMVPASISIRSDQRSARGVLEATLMTGAIANPYGVPRPKMTNHGKGQQKNRRRCRGQHDKRDIDDAVQLLTAAAMFAGGTTAELRDEAE